MGLGIKGKLSKKAQEAVQENNSLRKKIPHLVHVEARRGGTYEPGLLT